MIDFFFPYVNQPDGNAMLSRLPLLAVLLCLGAMLPGCTVCQLARLVSLDEPDRYDTKADRKISLVTYRALADEAWATTGACSPDDCTSADFTWGFREGFAEYVYAGGSGEPPALPPRTYWQSDMRTPEGAMAVRSWFQGYRYGAQVAREGGYRHAATVTVSASVRDCDACGRPNGCSRDECKTCFSPSDDCFSGPSPFEISGPALQQPELQQPEELTPEVVIPAPESLPTPQSALPLPSIDALPNDSVPNDSVPNDSVPNDTKPKDIVPEKLEPNDQAPDEEELDLPFLFGTSSWKASSTSPRAQRDASNTLRHSKPSVPLSATDNQAHKVPSQQHPVSQAFFPLVR